MELVISLLALLISLLSFGVSFAGYRLTKKQEARKAPLLVPYLINGYVQRCAEEQSRVYAFLLSVSNPSDSNNALSSTELYITYSTPGEAQVTVRVPASQSKGKAFADISEFPILTTPARLDAHQTLTGWSVFHASEAILAQATIDGYEVVLLDSHGIKTSVTPIFVQELQS